MSIWQANKKAMLVYGTIVWSLRALVAFMYILRKCRLALILFVVSVVGVCWTINIGMSLKDADPPDWVFLVAFASVALGLVSLAWFGYNSIHFTCKVVKRYDIY